MQKCHKTVTKLSQNCHTLLFDKIVLHYNPEYWKIYDTTRRFYVPRPLFIPLCNAVLKLSNNLSDN
jgi:hypothetical protein